jgi:hypothetical protein
MAKKLTPAELANRITYFLKGDLKNIQTAYLHAGAKLARIRDESLYRALGYPSMENYAQERFGMRRTTLYRYLAIYDWARKSHREWLGKHPKGFIPELTDAYGLKWIEERLDDRGLGADTRRELEVLRKKALEGKLTDRELKEFRARGRKRHDTLGAITASLRAIRRRAGSIGDFPPAALGELDALLDLLKSASGALRSALRPANPRAMRPRECA